MREIKFRAWSKTQNRMFQWGEILSMNLNNVFMGEQYSGLELQQFTGLHDKNGKEIYEGDILQVGKEYSGTFNPTYVTFEDGSFRHQISHMHNPVVLNSAIVMVLEVIGNIYENKEL